MDEQFSFKDFENVTLKATYDMEIGNRHISKGEIITKFDKIQIAGLEPNIKRTSANGGFDNRAHVFWETMKEISLVFSQGVFNKTQFALLLNSKILDSESIAPVAITEMEALESDENGQIQLKYAPVRDLFIYNTETGEKIVEYTIEDNIITISSHYLPVTVAYVYEYIDGAQVMQLGQNLFNGYVELEGRTRIKDDTTGRVVTGIIKIPRLKLMSNMSIRLGAQANPLVATFNAIGVPVGSRGNSYVSELCLLNDDIESDL